MTTKQFSEASITVVSGGFGEARDQAVEVASDTGRELVPVRVFKQGDRTMLSGVITTKVMTRIMAHNSARRGSGVNDALTTSNRPIISDHVKGIKEYLLAAVNNHGVVHLAPDHPQLD